MLERRVSRLTVNNDTYDFSKPEPIEIEDIVGPITQNSLFFLLKRLYDISDSFTLRGRLRELVRKYKGYCRTEPVDTEVSIQLWLWEHIVETYKKVKAPLSEFTETEKINALTFLTQLYIDVFEGNNIEQAIEKECEGRSELWQAVIVEYALPYLKECQSEISRVSNIACIENH